MEIAQFYLLLLQIHQQICRLNVSMTKTGPVYKQKAVLAPSSAEHAWRVLGTYSNANQRGLHELSSHSMGCITPVPRNLGWLQMSRSICNSFDLLLFNLTNAFHCNTLCRAANSPIWGRYSRTKFPGVATEDASFSLTSDSDDSGIDSSLILVSICFCRILILDSSSAISRYLSLTSGDNTSQLRLIEEILCRLVNPAWSYWWYWSRKYNTYAVRAFGAPARAKLCN